MKNNLFVTEYNCNCNSLHGFIVKLIMLQAVRVCAKESNDSLIVDGWGI